MTKRLTPAEYYEHAKALFPTLTHIARSNGDIVAVVYPEGRFTLGDNIEWGDIDQWPPKESERKWRWARMPEDWDKPARFRRYDGEWSDGVLAGYIVKDCVWLDHSLCTFDECQVEDIPAQAETPPKADRSEVVCPERENVGGSSQVPTKTHPADREPTDEEVERAALAYDPQINGYGQEFACFKAKNDVRDALNAWQQVWREST